VEANTAFGRIGLEIRRNVVNLQSHRGPPWSKFLM
jgi:hypothetical protein